MTMLTRFEAEIEFDLDQPVLAQRSCRGMQRAGETKACRSHCNAIGQEFAEAVFQLPSLDTAAEAYSASERPVASTSQTCERAVLNEGIASLADGAKHRVRGG